MPSERDKTSEDQHKACEKSRDARQPRWQQVATRTAIGTFCGTMVGAFLLSPIILSQVYVYDHGFGEAAKSDLLGTVLGAVCGAVFTIGLRFR